MNDVPKTRMWLPINCKTLFVFELHKKIQCMQSVCYINMLTLNIIFFFHYVTDTLIFSLTMSKAFLMSPLFIADNFTKKIVSDFLVYWNVVEWTKTLVTY
jgi:hypothetical protein